MRQAVAAGAGADTIYIYKKKYIIYIITKTRLLSLRLKRESELGRSGPNLKPAKVYVWGMNGL